MRPHSFRDVAAGSSRFRLRLLWVLISAAAISLAADVQGAGTDPYEGKWIHVPLTDFLDHRVIVLAGSGREEHRVVIECAAAPKWTDVRPKIIKGSGDSTIDQIAFDYVRSLLKQQATLRASSRTSVLVFPLIIVPRLVSVTDAERVLPGPLRPASSTPPGQWRTPTPPYPAAARYYRQDGRGGVELKIRKGQMYPHRVAMTVSVGPDLLDFNSLVFALRYWQVTSPAPNNITRIVPIQYELTR